MDLETWALILGIPAFFVLFFAVIIWSARRANRRWVSWAGEVGWRSIGKWPEGPISFSGGPFGYGQVKRAELLAQGTFDGTPAQSFRYRVIVRSGVNMMSTNHYIFRIILPGAQFPALELEGVAEGGVFTKILDRNVAYERQWNLSYGSSKFANEVMTPELVAYLRRPNCPAFDNLWFEGDSILVNRNNTLTVQESGYYLRLLTDVARLLPDSAYAISDSARPKLDDSGYGPDTGSGEPHSGPEWGSDWA